MNKRIALVLIAVVLVSIILFSAILFLSTPENRQTEYPTPQPKGGMYLHFLSDYQGGKETKVYLVNSQLFYGAYDESFTRSGALGFYSINKGDPCVIINGTIRNEYDKDYYFGITANVYNSTGEKIGPILTINSPMPSFTVSQAHSNSEGFFEIRIKYAAKDIVSYTLFVAFEPTVTPPA